MIQPVIHANPNAAESKCSSRKSIRETCKWDLDTFFLLIQSCLQHVGAACMEWCSPGHRPPLPCKMKERSPVSPHSTHTAGRMGTGQVRRLVLVLCCEKSRAGNRLFLKSARTLLLSFRETVLEAEQGRKHMLQMESKSIMAKVVVYTAGKDLQSCCFFPRRTGLSNASLHVVSQSEN